MDILFLKYYEEILNQQIEKENALNLHLHNSLILK